MAVTMADITKLRKMTGAGMMDCKNALTEADGDYDKAMEIIRKKGQAVAAKRSEREASEGCVLAKTTGDYAVVIALKCETDFERWIYVLKNMETLKRLPFKARKSVFEKLEKIVDIASLSKEERMKYDESIKVYRDNLVTLEFAEQKGRAEGKEETARNLKKMGVSLEIISKATGLSIEKIDERKAHPAGAPHGEARLRGAPPARRRAQARELLHHLPGQIDQPHPHG